MLEIVGKGDEMEYYYLSKYPIRLCNDYIKHSNVYDRFIYTWEEEEGRSEERRVGKECS